MVDRAALEMQCTARYRGFESLPLRQLDLADRLALAVSLIGPFKPKGGMRTQGSVKAAGRTGNPSGLGRSPVA